jgi:hypothetical protein
VATGYHGTVRTRVYAKSRHFNLDQADTSNS